MMLKTRWPAVPIEDLCTRVTSGGTPSRSNPAYYDDGSIPWIKTGELRGWYVDDIAERITPAAVRESSAKVFPPETVLLAMYGDGKTMGSVGLVRTPAATNQACCAMLADPKKCDPKFLMYSLVYFKPAILKLAISGAQRNLNGKSIKQFAIGAPPVEVQQRIASILSAYDDLIENNTRRIAILEEMARRVFEEWFVRFRFPGHEGVRMVESELGLVPATWRVLPMSDVAEVIDCLHSKKPAEQEDGAGLMLQLFNIADNGILDLTKRFRVSAEDYSLWTSRMEAKEGDCVITNVGRVGAVAQIPQGVKAALGRNMTGVRAKQGALDPTYLLRYLLSSHMESEIVKKKDPGTIMDSLNVKGIVRLSVPVADANTMQAFDRVAAPMRRQVEVLVLKNANLRATRDLLLPRLISGELDVSAIPELEAVAA